MANQAKIVQLVAVLNQLTQEGQLKWEAREPTSSINLRPDQLVDTSYETRFEDRRLRIYEEKYKSWIDEDRYTWSSRVVLAFVDGTGDNAWEFPPAAGITDLLESVKYQTAGVDDYLESVLKKYYPTR